MGRSRNPRRHRFFSDSSELFQIRQGADPGFVKRFKGPRKEVDTKTSTDSRERH